MVAAFQSALLKACLWALSLLVLVLAARSRLLRRTAAKPILAFSRLPIFAKFVAAIMSFVCMVIGGSKTNSPPRMLSLAVPEMAQSEWKTANWNTRGAWRDSFWLEFEDGWVFPWGTNHLSGVEVVSYGEAWATPFDTNAIASAGAPFEIVPGLTAFSFEKTPSNTYRLAWTDAAVGRDTNSLVSAAIELFRNGDVAIATNGVATHSPRILPFPHDGFGQDAEWVSANFTNANEILAVGYPEWVDSQVGHGLRNGLYKLTVAVPDDSPETAFLTVGDLSVAITNAGDYVFLLWKGARYDLSVFPHDFTNCVYSAVDDVQPMRSQEWPVFGDRRWTEDRGGLELVVPQFPLVPFSPNDHYVLWKPSLSVSPSTWQPFGMNATETFMAMLNDAPAYASKTFHWATSDPLSVSIESPDAPVTRMTAHSSSVDGVSLSLTVTVLDCTLHSYFDPEYIDLDEEPLTFKVSAPNAIFVNDDDDNCNGAPDCLDSVTLVEDDVAEGEMSLHSPAPTNGTVVVEGVYGYDEGFAEHPLLFADRDCTEPIEDGTEFTLRGVTDWSKILYFNPATVSTSHPGVQVKARWRPETGPDIVASAFLTIVSPVAEPVNSTVTNVVEDGVVHSYAVNPCGVGIGREAYFMVEVTPASFPDDRISWVPSEGLQIVGSSKGRRVKVVGTGLGEQTLSVLVGSCASPAPTFTVTVVDNVTVNLRAWIIEDAEYHKRPVEPDDVRQMVKDANDVYAQVAVTLNLIEPIVITNIPNAYNALYNPPASATSKWSFWDIVNLQSDTGGLECYFVNSFTDSSGTLAANCSSGLVVTAQADYLDLAHEIGHAFGMADIYDSREPSGGGDLVSLTPADMISCTNAPADWSGGSVGKGNGGTRYYANGTTMSEVLSRMLMKGIRDSADTPRDITSGDIYGVYVTGKKPNETIHKGLAPVGFPWENRNPQHR